MTDSNKKELTDSGNGEAAGKSDKSDKTNEGNLSESFPIRKHPKRDYYVNWETLLTFIEDGGEFVCFGRMVPLTEKFTELTEEEAEFVNSKGFDCAESSWAQDLISRYSKKTN